MTPFTKNSFPTRPRWVVIMFGLAVVGAVKASLVEQDAEKERLAHISYELTQVQAMIDDAAVTSEKSGRARFRYDLLSRDLQLIQQGISDHLQKPAQPRRVQPLQGDYRN